jgi:3-hydroxymyristoyl/3-hydroxydecanoyl-(acyl carrier protein) dehydratase
MNSILASDPGAGPCLGRIRSQSTGMPGAVLDTVALEAYLPHRGRNLFIDEVVIDPDGRRAVSTTCVPAGDSRGREFFAQRGPGGRSCWYSPFLGELLALTGVTLQRELLAADQVAVFSAISNCIVAGLAPLDETVIGYAELKRVRSGFCQYDARIECGGRTLLTGEIMSGVATFREILAKEAVPLPPGASEPVDPAIFAWKDPALRFVDEVRSFDAAAGRLVAAYTYPADHPLIPGHFPSAPIMMGVTQWAAIADAGTLAMRRLGLRRATINGSIDRADGRPVISVRDLVLRDTGEGVEIDGVKRLLFRGPVTPGDGILISVTAVAC